MRWATRVAAIGGGGAALYWGNYSDYLARITPPEPEAAAPTAAAAKRPKRRAKQAGGAGGERPRGKNRLRQLRREWRTVFEAIADTEAAVESLEARMAAPGFFGRPRGIPRSHGHL